MGMDARTKQVWRGLVGFANAPIERAAKELQRTLTKHVPWVVQADEWESFTSGIDWTDDKTWVDAATAFQPPLQTLLRWLCSGAKSEERKSLRAQAFGFLHEHSQHIGGVHLVEVNYVPEPKPDKDGNFDSEEVERHDESMKFWSRAGKVKDDSPLGIYTISRRYKDVADPICDFICSEYMKFRNGEYKQSVPILVCPTCTKLVMPDRIGRKKSCTDCSPKSRRDAYRKAALPDEDDYRWLLRLKEKLTEEIPQKVIDVGDDAAARGKDIPGWAEEVRLEREMHLKKPQVAKRIAAIKKTGSELCQKLIREMEL